MGDGRWAQRSRGAILSNPVDVDPEFEAKVRLHRTLVEEGGRRVTRPTTIFFFSTCALAMLTLLINPYLGLGVLWGGWGLMLWFNSRWFDRWWGSAIVRPGIDADLLQEMGIESGLLHSRSGFFGRWQQRSLARLTASVRGQVTSGASDATD